MKCYSDYIRFVRLLRGSILMRVNIDCNLRCRRVIIINPLRCPVGTDGI